MKRRNSSRKHQGDPPNRGKQTTLKRTDKAALTYLKELAQLSDTDTCLTSNPKIASACNISTRQVQISIQRLIAAGYINRVGYDFINPDRTKRGTTYKILTSPTDTQQPTKEKAKAIRFLMFWEELE